VASHSGGLSNRNGKSHAALNDIALMAGLPHVRIWSPADPEDLFFAMRSIVTDGEPAYLRLPRRPLPPIEGQAGLLRIIHPPNDLTIISTGLATHLAIDACEQLRQNGYAPGLIHCPRISPLPAEALRDLVRDAKQLVVIEDHITLGGLSSIVMALGLDRPVTAIGWPLGWTGQSGADESILELHGLDGATICERIMQEPCYR